MRRRVAVAGACVVTAFAATVGLGAGFGLFDLAQPDSPVGRLDDAGTASVVSTDAGTRVPLGPAVGTTPVSADGHVADD